MAVGCTKADQNLEEAMGSSAYRAAYQPPLQRRQRPRTPSRTVGSKRRNERAPQHSPATAGKEQGWHRLSQVQLPEARRSRRTRCVAARTTTKPPPRRQSPPRQPAQHVLSPPRALRPRARAEAGAHRQGLPLPQKPRRSRGGRFGQQLRRQRQRRNFAALSSSTQRPSPSPKATVTACAAAGRCEGAAATSPVMRAPDPSADSMRINSSMDLVRAKFPPPTPMLPLPLQPPLRRRIMPPMESWTRQPCRRRPPKCA
mmetsp:Transcript_101041/g.290802  ORF Transcript_101041/g.290802 Transcript_101041/m.290802 type:complete len:257 (+) Transcript_101041:566-1336(+)